MVEIIIHYIKIDGNWQVFTDGVAARNHTTKCKDAQKLNKKSKFDVGFWLFNILILNK